jgi:two-component system, NarL family, sensor histidine kinase UhpB
VRLFIKRSEWGITTRLVMIATIPSLLSFVLLSGLFFVAERADVATEVQRRGRALASALAESSVYGLVAGNLDDLKRAADQVMRADAAVVGLQVMSAEGAVLLQSGRVEAGRAAMIEQPVTAATPDVSVFDKGGPHVAAPGPANTSFTTAKVIGIVRVAMSAEPVVSDKRDRLYWAIVAGLLASVLSAAAGLVLARRLQAPLESVMRAVRAIRSGKHDVMPDDPHTGEIGELQTAIKEMGEAVRLRSDALEAEVAKRTESLQRAMTELAEVQTALGKLITQGDVRMEEERQRIAFEIHDHLNSSLLVVRLDAEQIAESCDQGPGDLAQIGAIAQRIVSTTSDLYASGRGLIKQLRPEVIDTLGLKSALTQLVRKVNHAHPQCHFEISANANVPNLTGHAAITAYRVIQEALANVIKHAGASSVKVELSTHEEQLGLVIRIHDNGRGFNVRSPDTGGLGLVSMRQRVAGVGGTFHVDSEPSHGTQISIHLPCAGPELQP